MNAYFYSHVTPPSQSVRTPRANPSAGEPVPQSRGPHRPQATQPASHLPFSTETTGGKRASLQDRVSSSTAGASVMEASAATPPAAAAATTTAFLRGGREQGTTRDPSVDKEPSDQTLLPPPPPASAVPCFVLFTPQGPRPLEGLTTTTLLGTGSAERLAGRHGPLRDRTSSANRLSGLDGHREAIARNGTRRLPHVPDGVRCVYDRDTRSQLLHISPGTEADFSSFLRLPGLARGLGTGASAATASAVVAASHTILAIQFCVAAPVLTAAERQRVGAALQPPAQQVSPHIPPPGSLHIELVVRTSSPASTTLAAGGTGGAGTGGCYRLRFTSAVHEVQQQAHHTRFPLRCVRTAQWVQLYIDVDGVMQACQAHRAATRAAPVAFRLHQLRIGAAAAAIVGAGAGSGGLYIRRIVAGHGLPLPPSPSLEHVVHPAGQHSVTSAMLAAAPTAAGATHFSWTLPEPLRLPTEAGETLSLFVRTGRESVLRDAPAPPLSTGSDAMADKVEALHDSRENIRPLTRQLHPHQNESPQSLVGQPSQKKKVVRALSPSAASVSSSVASPAPLPPDQLNERAMMRKLQHRETQPPSRESASLMQHEVRQRRRPRTALELLQQQQQQQQRSPQSSRPLPSRELNAPPKEDAVVPRKRTSPGLRRASAVPPLRSSSSCSSSSSSASARADSTDERFLVREASSADQLVLNTPPRHPSGSGWSDVALPDHNRGKEERREPPHLHHREAFVLRKPDGGFEDVHDSEYANSNGAAPQDRSVGAPLVSAVPPQNAHELTASRLPGTESPNRPTPVPARAARGAVSLLPSAQTRLPAALPIPASTDDAGSDEVALLASVVSSDTTSVTSSSASSLSGTSAAVELMREMCERVTHIHAALEKKKATVTPAVAPPRLLGNATAQGVLAKAFASVLSPSPSPPPPPPAAPAAALLAEDVAAEDVTTAVQTAVQREGVRRVPERIKAPTMATPLSLLSAVMGGKGRPTNSALVEPTEARSTPAAETPLPAPSPAPADAKERTKAVLELWSSAEVPLQLPVFSPQTPRPSPVHQQRDEAVSRKETPPPSVTTWRAADRGDSREPTKVIAQVSTPQEARHALTNISSGRNVAPVPFLPGSTATSWTFRSASVEAATATTINDSESALAPTTTTTAAVATGAGAIPRGGDEQRLHVSERGGGVVIATKAVVWRRPAERARHPAMINAGPTVRPGVGDDVRLGSDTPLMRRSITAMGEATSEIGDGRGGVGRGEEDNREAPRVHRWGSEAYRPALPPPPPPPPPTIPPKALASEVDVRTPLTGALTRAPNVFSMDAAQDADAAPLPPPSHHSFSTVSSFRMWLPTPAPVLSASRVRYPSFTTPSSGGSGGRSGPSQMPPADVGATTKAECVLSPPSVRLSAANATTFAGTGALAHADDHQEAKGKIGTPAKAPAAPPSASPRTLVSPQGKESASALNNVEAHSPGVLGQLRTVPLFRGTDHAAADWVQRESRYIYDGVLQCYLDTETNAYVERTS